MPLSAPAEARAKGVRFWGVPLLAKAQRQQESALVSPDGTIVLEESLLREASSRKLSSRLLAVPAVRGLRAARRMRPQLSADAVLAARKARLSKILDEISRDYL